MASLSRPGSLAPHTKYQRGLQQIAGSDVGVNRLEQLPQGASPRKYIRVGLAARKSPKAVVVMDLGDEPPSRTVGRDGFVCPELPFVNVLRHLSSGNLPVPSLYFNDEEEGTLFLEDFGDTTLKQAALSGGVAARKGLYDLAIRELIDLQAYTSRHQDPSCIAYHRGFDWQLLHNELRHFDEWIIQERSLDLSPVERRVIARSFERLAGLVADIPRLFVHRDYQSTNLMVLEGRLGILDFQDALLGPRPYDLVALLRDSYVVMEPDEVEGWVDRYLELATAQGVPIDPRLFREEFALVTLQRKLKDAGRFVFVDRARGNPSFRRYVPDTLRYVRWALDRLPEFAELSEVLRRHVREIG